jgi:hypothetical protein
MIKGIVNLVRTRYDATVSIIFRFDGGFLDEKNFALCDQLRVGFVATGKTFEAVKQKVAAIPEEEWKEYANEQQVWSYARFQYQCDKWKRGYRALYTRPLCEGQ